MILLRVTSHQPGTRVGLCLNAGPIRNLVISRLMYMHDKVSACIGGLDPNWFVNSLPSTFVSFFPSHFFSLYIT